MQDNSRGASIDTTLSFIVPHIDIYIIYAQCKKNVNSYLSITLFLPPFLVHFEVEFYYLWVASNLQCPCLSFQKAGIIVLYQLKLLEVSILNILLVIGSVISPLQSLY